MHFLNDTSYYLHSANWLNFVCFNALILDINNSNIAVLSFFMYVHNFDSHYSGKDYILKVFVTFANYHSSNDYILEVFVTFANYHSSKDYIPKVFITYEN